MPFVLLHEKKKGKPKYTYNTLLLQQFFFISQFIATSYFITTSLHLNQIISNIAPGPNTQCGHCAYLCIHTIRERKLQARA
jgi:hypothetical protein